MSPFTGIVCCASQSENNDSKQLFFSVDSSEKLPEDGDITFVCARYNPEKGTCTVRRTNTGLDQVLLAKCREMKSSLPSPCKCQPPANEYLTLHDVILVGMTDGATVLGQVDFTYGACQHVTCNCRHHEHTAAFVLDLNTLLDMAEPAATFAAISLPFHDEMLLDRPKKPSQFCPYYTSHEDGSALAGLVEVDKNVPPRSTTIHSFHTALEWKPLD